MCRLFAYLAPHPTSLVDVLGRTDFEAFTNLTTFHADGWGMAWQDADGHLQHASSPTAARDDPTYRQLAEQACGRAGIVHLRWASPGMPVSAQNTHPFVDAGLAMAHNGHIGSLDRLERFLSRASKDRLRGGTDSERYFRYVLQRIDALGDEHAGVTDAVADLAEAFPTSSLNALLLTPTRLFAVHVNSRATPPEALRGLGIAADRIRHTEDEYFAMDYRTTAAGVQIISSGLDPAGWTAAPDDSIGTIELATAAITWSDRDPEYT